MDRKALAVLTIRQSADNPAQALPAPTLRALATVGGEVGAAAALAYQTYYPATRRAHYQAIPDDAPRTFAPYCPGQTVRRWIGWTAGDDAQGIGQGAFHASADVVDDAAEREGNAAERLAELIPETAKGNAMGRAATLEYLRAAKREALADRDDAREALQFAKRAMAAAKRRAAEGKGNASAMAAAREAYNFAKQQAKDARERLNYANGAFRHYRNSATSPKRWLRIVDKINDGTHVFRWNVETRDDKARQLRHAERAKLLQAAGALRKALALAQAMRQPADHILTGIVKLESAAAALA